LRKQKADGRYKGESASQTRRQNHGLVLQRASRRSGSSAVELKCRPNQPGAERQVPIGAATSRKRLVIHLPFIFHSVLFSHTSLMLA
jgi:hypothetical protein